MDARLLIIESFKTLLKKTPYAKVTVADICREAHLSRNCFYSHFEDKEAIVRALFSEHVIEPLNNLNNLFSPKEAGGLSRIIQVKLYANIAAEADYYYNLVRTMRGHDDTFLRVATNCIYGFNLAAFRRLNHGLTDLEKDYVSYFFASSQAMLVQKWVSDKMPLTPDELADLYTRMTWPFWDSFHSKL